MDFKKYLKNKALSKTTIESYYAQTMEFITFLDKDNTEIENCTEKEIMRYLGELNKKELSQQTKKLRLYALKHFFDYQIENNQRNDNPAKRIKIQVVRKQRIYQILSVQELQNLYESYQVPKEDDKRSHHNWFHSYKLSRERNKVILGLLINQGITTAEVKRILTDDLDLRKGTIDIRGGRIGKDRTLELKSHQIMDLMEYQYKTRTELLKFQQQSTQQLFLSTPSSGENYASGNGNLQIWKSLTKELKTQNPKVVNFKQVRASVITHWFKQYNLRQVQYRAGHRHIHSTEEYLINDIEDLQTEIDKFHPLG